MGFNAEAYRKEAKALGIPDAEIDADIEEEMANSKGQFAEPTVESVNLNKNNVVPGWLQPAAAVAGVGLAAKGAKSLYDRYIGGNAAGGQAIRIEPQMDVSQKPVEGRVEPIWEPKQVIEQANATQPVMKTPAQAAQEAVAAGEIPAKGRIGASQQDIEILGNVAKAKQEKEIAKAGIKPPQQKTFASEAELKVKNPEAVFKPGLGPGDNWLYNTYGAEGRKAILSQFNEGKPAGSYEDAVALSKKAQNVAAGPQVPRDVAKTRGIPPTETNYGKLGRTAKVAGTAGLLLAAGMEANAAEQAAQAAKRGDTQMTRGYLTDIIGALTGPFGMIGSQIFGTSPEDLKILRAAEQARKAGAGRGTTKASEYGR